MAEKKCRECGHGNPAAALYCESCGKALHAAERDPLIGQTIASRYYLHERIGQGSAGILYRAEHVTLRRRMAVKLLHKHLATSDDAVERFRREAITVCEIDNDHIPQVHDFGRADDGRLFFAMEFLEGEPLSQLVSREGRLSVERTVDILAQIADGLMEAHTLGYVHRDLRPRSIFLSRRRGRQDFVKILDFGLAKLVQPEVDAQRTAMGMTYGDPRYMAPEQARGDTVDRRSDIYSMGAIGFEMLTGEAPFLGEGAFAILGKVLDAPVPRVRDRRPDCPAWLESIIRVALSKSPSERFQTVSQLLDALERKQVLQTQPAMPGPQKGAAGKVGISGTALRPVPTHAGLSGMGSAAGVSSDAIPAPSPTLALPTMAPARAKDEPEGIRHTLAYPAVGLSHSPSEPAARGRAAGPAAEAPPPQASTTDEIRLIGARTAVAPPAPEVKSAPAAKAAPAAKPVPEVKAAPVKKAAPEPRPARETKPGPGPLTPVAAAAKPLSAAKPAAAPTSTKAAPAPAAARPAAATPAVIKPTTPKRADPTPRTVSTMIEQESMGWLEAAQSLPDLEPPAEAKTVELVKAEPVKAEPVKAELVKAEPVKAEPVKAEPIKAEPVKAEPIKAERIKAEPVKAEPIKSALAARAREAAARPEPTPVKPIVAAPAPAAAQAAKEEEKDLDATRPTLKISAASEPESTVLVDNEAITALNPKLDSADTPQDSADTPKDSADTPKDNAAAGWFTNPSTAAEEGYADDAHDEDSYIIPRRRRPLLPLIAASAAGVLIIGWLALRSPSHPPPSPSVAPPPPAEVPPAVPPPAAVTPETAPAPTPPPAAATPGAIQGPAQPLAVSSGGEAAPPSEQPVAEPAKSAEPAKAEVKPVAEAPKPAAKPEAEAPKPAAKPVAEAPKPAAKPVAEAPKPAAKPVAEAPKPAAKPVAEAPKPAAKPVAEAPKPAAKPVAEAPKSAAKPVAEAPKPAAKPVADPAKPAKPSKPGESSPETLTADLPKPTAVDENGGKAQEAASLVTLGKKKLDDGEPEAAAQSFARAAELDPHSADAVGGLGEAAFEQGDFEGALRNLQKAIRIAPKRSRYQELLASVQFKLGRYKEAAETCRKLLKQDPGSKRAKQTLEQAEKKLESPN